MKRYVSSLVGLTAFASLATFVVACGGASAPPPAPTPVAHTPAPRTAEPPRTTPDAPFRANPPAPDGTVSFVAPKVTEAKLKNGVRVFVVERHDLPIVSVRLVVATGAGDVPDVRPGVVSFLGAMLEQGTKKRSALQLSDDFEAIGAQHGTWFDWDSGGVAVKTLSDRLDTALELMSDVALSPTFPEAEVERLKTRRITAIQSEKSSPGAVAQNALAASVFGRAHPYGHSISGEEADAKKLTRAEIARTYERLFVPQNAAIVVAGDTTKDSVLPKLEAAFGGWKAKPGAVTRTPPKTPAKAATDKRVVFVHRQGAQSQIQLARVGVPHATKDREAIHVTNAIFGGMFSSRVNLNLREKNAFTYGARSHFVMRHGAGPFFVGAAVFADKTGAAVKEVFSELEAIRERGVTDEELALAKENMLLALPGRFEGVSDVTSAVADLFVYDLPLDEFEKYPARVAAVTTADVKRIANELLQSNAMTLVVVGDRATVLPQLAPLQLGPSVELDPYGNPLDAGKQAPEATKKAPDAKKSAP